MITQGQQRAINAMQDGVLIVPKKAYKGGPYILTKDQKIRVQRQTFNKILDKGWIKYKSESEDNHYYCLSPDGDKMAQGPKVYGTPRRYKK